LALAGVGVSLAVIVAVAAGGFIYGLPGVLAPSRGTWQLYGMSINYPGGVNAQYVGVLDQQADPGSGEIEWLWNAGNTGLILVWVTTQSYNSTGGLNGIRSYLASSASNVVLTDQGTIVMAGHSWQYQTFSFAHDGVSGYSTFAVTYYSASGRAYALAYVDTGSGTLSSLESYGGTFSG
jgi:hypothetical protein